jgi:uracil-DNA glycosylase family 4
MSMLERIQVREAIHECTSCHLHHVAKAPVPFSGPSPSRVCVVGEAPGRTEDSEGTPFVGRSGQLLRQILRDVGFDDLQLAFVNAVCCFPDRTPTGDEINACQPNLRAQLEAIQPSYILVFGGIAVSALLAHTVRMGDVRGSWWRPSRIVLPTEAWCLATWHPAAVLRNDSLKTTMEQDLLYARLLIREEMTPEPSLYCLKCGTPDVDLFDDLPYCYKHKPKGR